MSQPEVSVLILSWNTREMTLECLEALARDVPRHSREIVVVDNGSEDGSADAIAERFPDVRLIRNPDNRYYSGGNNQAAEHARGRYYCLLNSDTQVTPGALDALVDWLEAHPDHAAVAPQLRSFDGNIQRHCSRQVGWLDPLVDSTSLGHIPPGTWIKARTRMEEFDNRTSRDVEQPSTTAMMVRSEDFRAVGGFDPEILVFFTDVDLCRKLLDRGRRIHFLADVAVFHHLGGSTRRSGRSLQLWLRDRAVFYRKHYGVAGDLWLRFVLRLHEFEQVSRIHLGPRRGEARRRAIEEVRTEFRSVREALG